MSADRKAKMRAAKLCLQLLEDQVVGLAGNLTGSHAEHGEHVYADYRMPCGGELTVSATVRFRAAEKPVAPPKPAAKKLGAERRLLLEGPKS